MKRGELYRLHRQLTAAAQSIMRLKNRDYGANDDPFRNFRAHGQLGILVRMHDKLSRLQTFVDTGKLAVKSESATDCVLDIINYAVLFEGYRRDANEPRGTDRDTAVEDTARTADQGLVARIADSRAGDAGSPAGGTRRRQAAKARCIATIDAWEASLRTRPGNSRSRAVDRQHRPRPRKGKKRI